MTESESPPRRWKLPSELTEDDRAAVAQLGHPDRIERREYRRWRRERLGTERDDLELRGRLLEEEAEVLRARAADKKREALDAVSVEQWVDRDRAKRDGEEPDPLDDGGAAELDADAAELEREAEEIAAFVAETKEN